MAALNLHQYNFQLPPKLVAQQPRRDRDGCRLLVVDRQTKTITHHRFSDLPELLTPGDALVVNDTKVIPARLYARRVSGGRAEIVLIRKLPAGTWEVLLKPSVKIKLGGRLIIAPKLKATVIRKLADGVARVKFYASGPVTKLLARHGQVPLPPYLKRPVTADDQRYYQTVYARHAGAVAAPTAGLHFTTELLNQLARAAIKTTNVTLHVGYGTFQPLRETQLRSGKLHPEYYAVTAATANAIAATHRRSGRVVAVGTTVVRTLEHVALQHHGKLVADRGETRLLITPGFQFQVVDALITNFHLPKSSLLMLVCAFGSRALILRAYQEAIANKYRFYSYGDAMLIV